MTEHRRGWWNMACFNGLSAEQQERVVQWGNLPFGYEPEGTCPRPAEVAVETYVDEKPGPRFYCRWCALVHITDTLIEGAPDEELR
jgi:hypothetical protein